MVICGMVDYWYMFVLMGVMKVGKDVYCEKLLMLIIDEGKWFVEV